MAEPIRPKDLPSGTPVAGSDLIFDSGTQVLKAKPLDIVNAGRPLASQAEAEAGVDNVKIISPLRLKQAIDEQVNPTNKANVNLGNVVLDGSPINVTASSGAQASKTGENITVINTTNVGHYGVRYAAYVKDGNLNNGDNDIGDALITRHASISSGFVWGRWDVIQSPLAVGSGLTGAPVVAQSFAMVKGEVNPQNRHGNTGWEAENRRYDDWVGGEQWVPETQDFSGLLGNNRVGYHIAFARSLAKSPYTSNFGTMAGRHARWYNVDLINPNAIAAGGFATFATGFRLFPTAVAISAAGTGYTVGDQITFNTGLGQSANQNTVIKVISVNGGGGITGVELFEAGWYQQSFASPIGVTGGTGTGATFTYTLASGATELPQGMIGLAGFWEAGINCCVRAGANSIPANAAFQRGVIVAPNDNNIIVARNAADSVDFVGLKLNASDRWELAASEIVPWTAYTPTITADSGAFGSPCTILNARYSRINNTVTVIMTFTVVAVGTAAGAIRVTLPVAAANYFAANVINLSDGVGLVASGDLVADSIRFSTAAGAFPGINGKNYTITATYEAA